MALSIRNILVGLFAIFSAAVCVMTGISAWDAYGRYQVYGEVKTLASLDGAMFEALVNMRNERGNAMSALKQELSENAETVSIMAKSAEAVDKAMESGKVLLPGVAENSVKSSLSTVYATFDKWIALRSSLRAELQRPADERDPQVFADATDLGQSMLTALEAASQEIEGVIRSHDPSLTAITQIRSFAWNSRALIGAATLTLNTSLASKQAMPAQDLASIRTNESIAAYSWKQTKSLVEHPQTAAKVKTAFAAADEAYFTGSFAAERQALMADFAASRAAPTTLDAWRLKTTPALKSVANLAAAAVDQMLIDADTVLAKTFNRVLAFLGGFLVAVGLSIFGIAVIVLRVVRPVGALTQCMQALAKGELDVSVPGTNRADEIGGMARSVEVFQRAAVRNRTLEAEAGQQRQAAEEQRAEVQRRAEADAEERLNQATGALASGLRKLAAGDLLCEIDEALAPQFEALRNDFNTSVHQLREALHSVGQSAMLVTSGSAEISQASDNLSKRTEQQAASIEETAAALEEVTANVKSTSRRASDARDLVRGARDRAESSSNVVSNAVEAMGKIEHSSKQISQIIGVIDEIAFQTNLLALNAGVEAARAGDAGKGFAVVAQEVRELAQRSANAAKEIKALIGNSEAAVSEGVRLVSDTGDGLNAIADLVQSINQHMDAIATAAEEQALGLSEINDSVNHMDQSTQQNAAMVEEMNAAGSGLARESSRLKELLSGFRTGDQHPAMAAEPQPRSRPVPVSRQAERPKPARAAASRGNAALNKLQQEWNEF